MEKTKVTYMDVDSLIPYANNPRLNDNAVDAVAASIKEFGFKVPIVVDGENVIINGHTRLKAAHKLGLKQVPVIVADDLTPAQVKAFRLADNKTSEFAEWDMDKLDIELDSIADIDMGDFGFDLNLWGETHAADSDAGDWFDRDAKDGDEHEDGNDEYNEFVDKFKPKKTTDDCYTPDNVYEAVAAWVSQEYGIDRRDMVRPFYPGGDYRSEDYAPGCCVVDNPPFSILSEIQRFYQEHGVRFFLFAPTLTLFSRVDGVCYVPCYGGVTYENGAEVGTSFVTNLETDLIVRTAPALSAAMRQANDANLVKKQLPKYSYPPEVITSAMVARWCFRGVDFRLRREDALRISALDAQRLEGKCIYGRGFLLSENATRDAETAAREAEAAARDAANADSVELEHVWELSERERGIVANLGKNDDDRAERESIPEDSKR
ncbi:ParB N-terminal domain-containing protein [uncultured Senegalimassilia sp.]|uniref:ParB N-terminal domain-containing protein n=1 Tax=uncultured Senegalimassilia sp. TaxID=1714350 RepID=UPI0026380A9E|nr:ParB N-terminal domain-containing protein [uncultured Senegalimassilia sp.]